MFKSPKNNNFIGKEYYWYWHIAKGRSTKLHQAASNKLPDAAILRIKGALRCFFFSCFLMLDVSHIQLQFGQEQIIMIWSIAI